jgi:adenylate cyclase
MRSSVQIRTLNPEVAIVLYLWQGPETKDAGIAKVLLVRERSDPHSVDDVRELSFSHGAFESETWQVSPFFRVVEHGEDIRCPLAPHEEAFEYPILKDLHAVGATDYVAQPLRFAQGPLSAISFVSDKEGGFTEDDVALLKAIVPALSMCFETHSARRTTRSLLRTYLGADPGERVLAGQVKPGDVQRIEAAILFSDLRGFTTLSSQTDSRELIGTLNDYFSAVTAPLEKNGGEILKFIGDALLVVFPLRVPSEAGPACQRALKAAIEANAGLDALNVRRVRAGKAPLEHGLGLHLGTAEYGNMGSTTRLDFTVIGRDVNLASRIEGMCGPLGRRLLASSLFVAQVPETNWLDFGEYPLKGLEGEQALFGIQEAGGATSNH